MSYKLAHKVLTPAQQSLYWRMHKKACDALGIFAHAEREEYRKRVMRESTGKEHLELLSRTGDFDAVLRRFSADAGDFDKSGHFAVSEERRLGYLIKVCCLQLMQLKGVAEADARRYLGGVLDQCRIANGVRTDDDSYWLDVPFGQAHKVFMMLDKHRQRLLHLHSGPTTFNPSVRYEVNGPILIRTSVAPNYYAAAPFKVNFPK